MTNVPASLKPVAETVPEIGGRFYPQVLSVTAKGVLDEYDYFLEYGQADGTDSIADRVQVIYAPNGSGKTNLLRAIYHLLTPDLDSLQALIEIPVSYLCIKFRSGAEVSLSREGQKGGAFKVQIISARGQDEFELEPLLVQPADFGPRMYRRVLTSRSDYEEYLFALQLTQSNALFVGDDRSVQSLAPIFEQQDSATKYVREVDNSSNRSILIGTARSQEVKDSLQRVEETFSRMAFAGISTEAQHGGGAYADITRNVLQGSSDEPLANLARAALTRKINELLKSGAAFEKYGLINLNQVRSIKELIENTRANNRHFKSLHAVVNPYLSDLFDQMSSLGDTKDLIDRYVTSVNSFLERKSLQFRTLTGITLRNKRNGLLEPERLSSGEKHLLLLLSNAVLASRIGCLFIIDEPELSLGIEWQRKLIAELLRCTEGSPVQFLIASHSIPIMADIDEIVSPHEVD